MQQFSTGWVILKRKVKRDKGRYTILLKNSLIKFYLKFRNLNNYINFHIIPFSQLPTFSDYSNYPT